MHCHGLRQALPGELDVIAAIDDATLELFVSAGVNIDVDRHPEFFAAERECWGAAIYDGRVHVACDAGGCVIGFVVTDIVDGEPYVEQLSVHPASMRHGLGSKLLALACAWSAERPLWLTTYGHLPWNRPFYERRGFEVVDERHWRPQMQSIIAKQRLALPHPEQRVVMVRRPQ